MNIPSRNPAEQKTNTTNPTATAFIFRDSSTLRRATSLARPIEIKVCAQSKNTQGISATPSAYISRPCLSSLVIHVVDLHYDLFGWVIDDRLGHVYLTA